jgi:hypothetical protein
MKTNEITEKMLYDGYDGLTNGLDKISKIKGETIIWNWRREDDYSDATPVCVYNNADFIELEYDRVGRISMSAHNSDHPVIKKTEEEEQAIYGDLINY